MVFSVMLKQLRIEIEYGILCLYILSLSKDWPRMPYSTIGSHGSRRLPRDHAFQRHHNRKGVTMTERITSGQRDRIAELARARTGKVVDAMTLDIDQAQLVITNGDEFGQIVGDAVRSALARLSVSQEYANEEVASTWVYPPEYTGPAPIGEQIDKLAALFGLGAIAGDLVKSFFKRRLKIAEGRPWIPFDQIDLVLGALICVSPVYALDLPRVLVLLLLTPFLHFLTNLTGYTLGLKDVWW